MVNLLAFPISPKAVTQVALCYVQYQANQNLNEIPNKDNGPYLAPSAIDFVHRRMCHSYFAPAQSALFPPQKHVAKLVNELALPGRFSAKKEACSGANNPWCYFAVPLNNCATDQKKPSLKSVARCALFIMLF